MHTQQPPDANTMRPVPGAPDEDGRFKAWRVLCAVDGACSIDAIAARLGAHTIKDVMRLKGVLRDLAAAGRLEDLGGGVWAGGAAEPEPGEPITAQDVLLHGFGDGAGPATIRRIADNVEAATGRDASRIAEIVTLLIDMGKISPSRSRCYVLTERAMAEIERSATTQDGGIQAAVLAAVPESGEAALADVMRVTGARQRLVQASLRSLVEAGSLVRIDGPRGSIYARTGDVPDDLALRIRMSGPALRRAMAALATPLTQRELAKSLGVTRERARQIANTLVERGLARSYGRRSAGSTATRVYVVSTAPAETPLEDVILGSMPARGMVYPADACAATDRRMPEVRGAFSALADRGSVVGYGVELRRVLYERADGGSPTGAPFPVAAIDLGGPSLTILVALAGGGMPLSGLRDALDRDFPDVDWSSERANSRVTTLRRGGLTDRSRGEDGGYVHALTATGERILAAVLEDGRHGAGATGNG